jgi:hypothetical protein
MARIDAPDRTAAFPAYNHQKGKFPHALNRRNPSAADNPAIIRLNEWAYPGMPTCSPGMVQGQITNFPEGQFVVEDDGEIVGYAASIKISEEVIMNPHAWSEAAGGGYGAQHDPESLSQDYPA